MEPPPPPTNNMHQGHPVLRVGRGAKAGQVFTSHGRPTYHLSGPAVRRGVPFLREPVRLWVRQTDGFGAPRRQVPPPSSADFELSNSGGRGCWTLVLRRPVARPRLSFAGGGARLALSYQRLTLGAQGQDIRIPMLYPVDLRSEKLVVVPVWDGQMTWEYRNGGTWVGLWEGHKVYEVWPGRVPMACAPGLLFSEPTLWDLNTTVRMREVDTYRVTVALTPTGDALYALHGAGRDTALWRLEVSYRSDGFTQAHPVPLPGWFAAINPVHGTPHVNLAATAAHDLLCYVFMSDHNPHNVCVWHASDPTRWTTRQYDGHGIMFPLDVAATYSFLPPSPAVDAH